MPDVAHPAEKVHRTTAGVGAAGLVYALNRERLPAGARFVEDLERATGDAPAGETARQRSAMRAAVALLLAGEGAGARIR